MRLNIAVDKSILTKLNKCSVFLKLRNVLVSIWNKKKFIVDYLSSYATFLWYVLEFLRMILFRASPTHTLNFDSALKIIVSHWLCSQKRLVFIHCNRIFGCKEVSNGVSFVLNKTCFYLLKIVAPLTYKIRLLPGPFAFYLLFYSFTASITFIFLYFCTMSSIVDRGSLRSSDILQ